MHADPDERLEDEAAGLSYLIEAGVAKVGDINQHWQHLRRKTDERGNHPFARLWVLKCNEPGCGREY